jgi:hypothetical protein
MSAARVSAHALGRAKSEHAITVVMRAGSDNHCAEPLSKEGASGDPMDLYRILERREEGSVV